MRSRDRAMRRTRRGFFAAAAALALHGGALAQQAAPPNDAPSAPTPPASTPLQAPAMVIGASAAATLLGKLIESANGEDMGRIVDAIVDRGGALRAVVVDFGGFLGVGTRKIAVDWRVLHFREGGRLDVMQAELPRDMLRLAPPYKPGEPIVVIGRADPAAPASAPTALMGSVPPPGAPPGVAAPPPP